MIEFNNKVVARVSEKWVCAVVDKVLRELKKKGDVSVVFVGDGEIKELNKKYKKTNTVTDVLSFSNLEGGKMMMPKGEEFLGEVIIGYEQAKKQAQERGHSVKNELGILLIHGILHLLGYEHEGGGREAEVMRERERELLKAVG